MRTPCMHLGCTGGHHAGTSIPLSPKNPLPAVARPVLAVAAVVAVALGRAVALQQAALAILGVLRRVVLPVQPVVVLYHSAKGGDAG